MTRIHGLYAALATPYDHLGEISDADLRSLVRFVLNQQIDGLYVGGSTGESLLQTTQERADILKTVAEETRGHASLIGHVGALSTKEACALAHICAQAGYAAISAIPPIYFRYSKDDIAAYYREISEASEGLPVMIYNIPAMSGVQFTTDDLARLIEIPGVIGIKQTAFDLYQSEQLRRRYPDLVILSGYDEIFLPAISVGANGAVGSTFNIMGARFRQILTLFEQGRNVEARGVQSKCNEVIDVLVRFGVFPSIKYILHRMGVIANPACRKPLPSLDSSAFQTLDTIASALSREIQELK